MVLERLCFFANNCGFIALLLNRIFSICWFSFILFFRRRNCLFCFLTFFIFRSRSRFIFCLFTPIISFRVFLLFTFCRGLNILHLNVFSQYVKPLVQAHFSRSISIEDGQDFANQANVDT